MKFQYIGEYPAGQDSAVFWGVPFKWRESVEVPDGSVAAALLVKHPSFRLVANAAPTPEEPRNRLVDAAAAASKDDLIAIADERGVKIDRRWTAEKIAAAIKAAV